MIADELVESYRGERMKHALAQFLRLLLEYLEQGSDERDLVTQTRERFDGARPIAIPPTKKNSWRAAGRLTDPRDRIPAKSLTRLRR
jgi:hypothetical protein